MKIDIRTTALMAAVTLGLLRAYLIIEQIRLLIETADLRGIYAIQLMGDVILLLPLLGMVILLLPLLVMLLLLYKNDAMPAIPRNRGYMALAAALAEGLFFVAPGLYEVSRMFRQNSPFQHFWISNSPTVGGQLWIWAQLPWTRDLLLSTWILLSNVAFILFLIALFRHTETSRTPDEGQARLVFRAAQVAMLMTGLDLALNIYRIFRGTLEVAEQFGVGTGMQVQVFLHALWPVLLSRSCWALAAWIVYKSFLRWLASPAVEAV